MYIFKVVLVNHSDYFPTMSQGFLQVVNKGVTILYILFRRLLSIFRRTCQYMATVFHAKSDSKLAKITRTTSRKKLIERIKCKLF